MKRAVIVCGAKIKDYELVSSHFREGDYFIYCDGGLIHEDRFLSYVDSSEEMIRQVESGNSYEFPKHAHSSNVVQADLIVGDFDSHERPADRENDTEIITLPREKDDTDSVYAIKEAIKRGFEEFLIVGAIGDRLDHSLVNVYALIYLYELGFKATIVDDYSEMCLIGKNKPELVDIKYDYFSLVAINGEVRGVDITNAKYTLSDGVISPSYQYATSNEPIKESMKPAEISVKEGYLLLIKVYADA